MKPNIVDLSPATRVDTFFSPPYDTSPPELRNGHLLTPALQQLYATLWHQNHGQEQVVCHVVSEAIVNGAGLVFDRDGSLIRQSIHQTSEDDIATCTAEVFRAIAADAIPRSLGVTLLCEKSGIGNYGHWLLEMLPIAMLNRRHFHSGGWHLRLPVATEAMNRVAADSIRLAGIPDSQVQFRLPGPQRYEQLVMVTGLTSHGVCYSPLTVACLETLASGLTAGPSTRLWISRAGDRRRLQCEAELCERLVDDGWLIANPAIMSLQEQIAAAKGAIHIAGVSGAGLTNIAFAAPGIRVTAFMPAPMPDVFFWMLAGFKRQRYVEVRCRQMPDAAGQGGWNSPLLLSPDEVIAELA